MKQLFYGRDHKIKVIAKHLDFKGVSLFLEKPHRVWKGYIEEVEDKITAFKEKPQTQCLRGSFEKSETPFLEKEGEYTYSIGDRIQYEDEEYRITDAKFMIEENKAYYYTDMVVNDRATLTKEESEKLEKEIEKCNELILEIEPLLEQAKQRLKDEEDREEVYKRYGIGDDYLYQDAGQEFPIGVGLLLGAMLLGVIGLIVSVLVGAGS